MAQGVGAGAAFLIYANGSLCGTVAHQTGLESSEFRTETVAMSLGLSALTALKDSHSYSSIRIFIDCQCLIATLSRGPARKSDSVCNSIWFQLSSIRKISSVHIQWIPTRACLATHCQLGDNRGSNIHQSSVRLDLAAVKVLIRRTGQEEFHARDIRDAHSATHGTLAGKSNPQCHRKLGCSRSHCMTDPQLRMIHSPLLAS